MQKFMEKFVVFMKEEDGPTAVEYAVMLALIVVVCLGTIGAIGSAANTKFQSVADSLSTP
ncbi:Flp family type IVb pilin [Candidatus Laterigemmans baculatus]|uniref:Flp family type IVb pilin n=1 Tax=Candidatus Laterigemmans baculatus TaxID=2770505 RepID=UPI0013DB1D8B|nr:Flp family type IVb pilin [Candidatus Laterigemmans baculatus]